MKISKNGVQTKNESEIVRLGKTHCGEIYSYTIFKPKNLSNSKKKEYLKSRIFSTFENIVWKNSHY